MKTTTAMWNAVLGNGLHQPAHAGLAVISFKLEDEDDNANKGDNICQDVRFLDIREAVGKIYLRPLPATCRPEWRRQER